MGARGASCNDLKGRMSIPVIASLGMGLHSSVMVDRWLTEPASRDFDLSDLIVISSQVGLEDEETRRQMEELLFPRLRAVRVRTVQIARRGRARPTESSCSTTRASQPAATPPAAATRSPPAAGAV